MAAIEFTHDASQVLFVQLTLDAASVFRTKYVGGQYRVEPLCAGLGTEFTAMPQESAEKV